MFSLCSYIFKHIWHAFYTPNNYREHFKKIRDCWITKWISLFHFFCVSISQSSISSSFSSSSSPLFYPPLFVSLLFFPISFKWIIFFHFCFKSCCLFFPTTWFTASVDNNQFCIFWFSMPYFLGISCVPYV